MRPKRTRRPKVLLAWDIENPAPAALAVVRRLVEGGAKAEAVYVAPPSFLALPEWDRRMLRTSWREKLGKQGVDLTFAEGGVVPRLLAYIEKRKPDLVVLGTKSSGWFEDLVLGSVAKSVRRRSAAPVLIVPARKKG